MTAQELLARVRAKGVRLEVRGLDLWASAKLPPILGDELRRQKRSVHFALMTDELSRLRRNQQPEQADRLAELEGVAEWYRDTGLDTWYRSGWLLLRSDLVGETVVIIRDERVEVPANHRSLALYTLAEARLLEGLDDEEIHRAHNVKKAFRGEVVAVQEVTRCSN